MIAYYIKRTGFGEGVSFMCQRHLTTNNPTQGTQCGEYKKERALAKEFPISARGTALLITPHKERSVGIKKERALAKEFPISAGGTALLITPHKERSVGDIYRIQTNNKTGH